VKIEVSPIVADALQQGRPVVALESTIIAHGFPRPDNLRLAHALEEEVRAGGSVPATIAVIDGAVRVGLGEAQLVRIANDPTVAKASVRDLGAITAAGESAATTVAATAHLACQAGIRVFATGGIGGVHRAGEESLDISADLRTLGRTPIAVVSAGAKAILDLGRTLEVLETEGVPVVGYRCDLFPSFYSRGAAHAVPHRVEDIGALCALCIAHWGMGLSQGVLVCNPIDVDDAIPPGEVEAWITTALSEARDRDVAGKALTPFVLGRLVTISGGRSLVANRALALGNARLAAELAVALARGSHGTKVCDDLLGDGG
jgi:pseudouridine-5'-phosphate glycosidase